MKRGDLTPTSDRKIVMNKLKFNVDGATPKNAQGKLLTERGETSNNIISKEI